ncbi:MAG: hypothetical protein RL637_262 [Pseudomonadota bacterium]|jgi:probable rRNA maturation factor
MNLIDLQIATEIKVLPQLSDFQTWVDLALADQDQIFEIVIRLVDKAESAQLNQAYRHKTGATNILSFPFEVPEGIELNLLGDLIICAPLVAEEAQIQHKPLLHHWAHLVIHGILHLRGYDHQQEAEALLMESLEINLLHQLTIANPYQEVIFP